MKNKRITIVCGHYGSGKTTFSINYALYMRNQTDKEIYIADLDVVNPYFRVREHYNYLKDKNIKVIGSYLPQSAADLPAVSAEVYTLFDNKEIIGIVDMGGNSVGSLSFATFRDNVETKETDIIFILNANRKENSTLDYALWHFNSIESTLGLKITNIVNNTHLMNETSIDDINRGESLAYELSKEKNIPVKFTCLNMDFFDNNPNIKTKYDLFIIGYDIKRVANII